MLPPRLIRLRTLAIAAFLWLIAGLATPPATAQSPVRLRIVGGLANINQYTRHEEPFWTTELPRLTQGRASAEIVPFDRAGIRGQEMMRLVQLGAVPFGTASLSASAALDPELAAPDLPGLSPDIASLRRSTEAFRPYLEKLLRERYGIELLALYVYPAQELYCSKPIKALSDVAGRRVRVSSAAQADWIEALGGIPVQTGFAEIVANLRSGNIECAITGTMSGNTIGLHEVTSHILSTPINWGLGAFVANKSAWAALPADVREVLKRELPRLEAAIWAESEQETGEGVACNVGAPSCKSGRKGRMVEVKDSPADQALRREILAKTVLPRWVQRCGRQCAEMWRQTLGPAAGHPSAP
jgi:TRAP-type C4-dicarboxylate transport system substrate-binding protein